MNEQQPTKTLNEPSVAFLTQECDRMLALYTNAQESAQNVFNFYLTFVTAVIGGTVVIWQNDPNEILLGGILFFAVIVGTVYLSALSGRYAHSARYALALDELRRYLIQELNVPVPYVYNTFLERKMRRIETKKVSWVYWLVPTGTYQMFVAIVNSTALAGVIWIVFSLADASAGRGLVASFIVFVLSLSILNAYSRLVILRFGSQMNVDLWHDSPAWAARGA